MARRGSTEVPNVEMIMCHFTKGELEGLDNLQGGPSIDPATGLREYSKLTTIIELPEVQKIFRHVNEELSEDGKVSPDLHKIYETAKQGSLEFEKAPQDRKPPTSIIEKKGRGDDKFLALIPLNVAKFLIELNGGYSINPKTGLLEFGLFKNIKNIVKRVFSNPVKAIGHGFKKLMGPEGIRLAGTIGGALLGGPMGMGLGAGLANAATGAGLGKSAMRGLGAYGLGTGVQAAGQMMGMGAATPYSNGFFGGSNAITGLLGTGNGAGGAAGGWHQVTNAAEGNKILGLSGIANGAGEVASSAAAAPGAGSFFGNVGNALMSPTGLMLGMTGLSALAAKKHHEDENKLAKMHNQEIDRQKEAMGYNLKWEPHHGPRTRRWAPNPNYVHGGNESYYNDLTEPQHQQAQHLKTGGFVKRKELRSFDDSTGIYGPGNGQDDKIKTSIPAGSYIIDASTTANLGDGSSSSGIKVLEETARQIRRMHPKKAVKHVEIAFKKNGVQTPVYVANEEFKFDPVTVALAGGGDIKKGASVFRQMVKDIRKHKASNGLGLPPKARHPMDYIKKSHKN